MPEPVNAQQPKPTAKQRLVATLWPPVDTLAGARKATRDAMIATIVIVVFSAGYLGYLAHGGKSAMEFLLEPEAFAQVLLLVVLALAAVALQFNSRVGAVTSFMLFTGDRIATAYYAPGQPRGWVLAIILILALFHGIRGTFAHHRLRRVSAA